MKKTAVGITHGGIFLISGCRTSSRSSSGIRRR